MTNLWFVIRIKFCPGSECRPRDESRYRTPERNTSITAKVRERSAGRSPVRLLAEYQKALSAQLVSKGNFSETETEIIANNFDRLVDRLTRTIDRLMQKQEQIWTVVRAMATELGLTNLTTLANTG